MTHETEELIQCIFDCMSEALPHNWKSASLRAKVVGDDVESSFQYVEENSDVELEFTPNNFIAPLNAVLELHQLAAREGRKWTNITVEVLKGGKLHYAVS